MVDYVGCVVPVRRFPSPLGQFTLVTCVHSCGTVALDWGDQNTSSNMRSFMRSPIGR